MRCACSIGCSARRRKRAHFTAYHRHGKRAKRRAMEILHLAPQATTRRRACYRELLQLTDATATYAMCALAHLKSLSPTSRARSCEGGISARCCPASRSVIDQTISACPARRIRASRQQTGLPLRGPCRCAREGSALQHITVIRSSSRRAAPASSSTARFPRGIRVMSRGPSRSCGDSSGSSGARRGKRASTAPSRRSYNLSRRQSDRRRGCVLCEEARPHGARHGPQCVGL